MRAIPRLLALAGVAAILGCSTPSSSTSDLDPVDVTVSPASPTATGPTGKFYKVAGDDNHPDEYREYDWKTSFSIDVKLTEDAADDNLNLNFPVKLTSATLKEQQATGGIVTPPTGTETERYESVSAASGNVFTGVNSHQTIDWEVWFDNPNLRGDALITITLGFEDDDGKTFSEKVEVRVAP